MKADLDLLWENSHFIAVNKPAGLLSIPGQNPKEPSVLKLLSRVFPRKSHLPVHRIDRDTSGVLLIARDEEAHRAANFWFMNHTVKKEYLALALGKPRLPAFRLNHLIDGKASLSQVQVIERFTHGEESAFLARVRIATGRRHQIRIHLQMEGFPVLGDTFYGGPREALGLNFPRFALHAEKLTLPLDAEVFGEDVGGREICAPLPFDFDSWLSELRAGGAK